MTMKNTPDKTKLVSEASDVKYTTVSMMTRIFVNYVRPFLGLLVLALAFMIVSAGMTAAVAKMLQPVMDEVLTSDGSQSIAVFAATVMGIFVVRGVATYAHVVIMNRVTQGAIAIIQKQLFSHFLTLDQGFYARNPSGQLISRVTSDVNVMRSTVGQVFTNAGKGVFTLIFLVIVMFMQDPILSIGAFTIFPVITFFVVQLGKKLRKISKKTQESNGILTYSLSQVFQGIRQVQAYGMEEAEKIRTGSIIDRVRRLAVKSVQVSNLSTPVNEILVGVIFFAIITYGGHQVREGAMTAGQLISFLGAFIMAYEPMKKLAKLNATLQLGLGAAARVFEMLDTAPEISSSENAKGLTLDKPPEIAFEDLHFTYPSNDERALNGVSFQAQAGKVTALVGHSGSGKTTLMNMVPRFYDPDSGSILVDGISIHDVRLSDLRSSLALVSQDITIFDDTIKANIAYSAPDATDEQIIAASKMAAAHDFIGDLPNGYDTRVGEDGMKLSGGQRQRISIARAILRDAPILLLDEATSALDNESEKKVQGALKALEKDRTTLVIAHRLSTIQAADMIIVLDKGLVAEQGTHEELMALGGIYASMHKAGSMT